MPKRGEKKDWSRERRKMVQEREERVDVSRFSEIERRLHGETNKVLAGHFLHWAAAEYPEVCLLWQEVAQAVFGKKRLPKETEAFVVSLQKGASHIRKYCRETFGCDVVCVKYFGVRATTSNLDIAEHSLLRDAKSARLAAIRVIETKTLVDDKELKKEVNGLPAEEREMHQGVLDYSANVTKALPTARRFVAQLGGRDVPESTEKGSGGGKG